MQGVQAYDLSQFHNGPHCRKEVLVIADVGYLLCNTCMVLANLQAVSPKFETWAEAFEPRPMDGQKMEEALDAR